MGRNRVELKRRLGGGGGGAQMDTEKCRLGERER